MMERGSTKHGAHTDEQLAREVSGLVHGAQDARDEEWTLGEPAGGDQPDGDLAPDTTLASGVLASGVLAGGVPAGMTDGDVETRTELARWLTRHAFPGDRTGLVEHLRSENAPDAVVELLAALPDGRYGSVGEVWRGLDRGVEQRP